MPTTKITKEQVFYVFMFILGIIFYCIVFYFAEFKTGKLQGFGIVMSILFTPIPALIILGIIGCIIELICALLNIKD